jgi:CHAD domain-containing protein
MEPFIYSFPSSLNLRKLRQHLPPEPGYRISLRGGEMQQAVLLDTFDNSMFQAGKFIVKVDRRLLLLDLQTGQLLEQAAPVGPLVIPDMERGPVVDMLLTVARLRALLPVAEVRVRKEEGRILDDQEKTLVRLCHLTISRDRRVAGLGCVRYLRGYPRAYEKLRQGLENCGAVACQNAGGVYAGLGIALREYCSKPEIRLFPETPVKESATIILRTFLTIARQNEQGIIADSDTEFLHDYRVCLRKIRSVLSLLGGVFDAGESTRLKVELADIMRTTNGLRDLDVYLLKKAEYYQLVPPPAHEGLQILLDELARRRKAEQRQVSTTLQRKQYLRRMEGLKQLFAAGANIMSGPQADIPSLLFARRLIMKRYRKVCKTGRVVDETTPDSSIHQLRIHCKKLRYLMEFFTPLFPPAEMKQLIRALKLLQDNLGNFNDYSVQRQFLEKLLQSGIASGAKALTVASSIGALTSMLYQLQRDERARIIEHLAAFDSPDIRDAFTKNFKAEGGEHEDKFNGRRS